MKVNPKFIDELIKHRDRKVAQYYLAVDMVQKQELRELIEGYEQLIRMLAIEEKKNGN